VPSSSVISAGKRARPENLRTKFAALQLNLDQYPMLRPLALLSNDVRIGFPFHLDGLYARPETNYIAGVIALSRRSRPAEWCKSSCVCLRGGGCRLNYDAICAVSATG
jgi:hypothetical protein